MTARSWFQWKLKSEEYFTLAKRLPAPVTWGQARLQLEYKLKLHVKSTKANQQRFYILGFLHGSDEPLGANDTIQPGAQVIVKRMPLDPKTYAKHTQNRVSPEEWEAMEEEARLDHICCTTTVWDYIYPGDAAAAAAAVAVRATPEEDAGVQCSACGRMGHTGRWCPSVRDNPGFVPLGRRRLPHGIPSCQLRPARECELDQAWLTQDGRLVVRK